jgi:Sulfatase
METAITLTETSQPSRLARLRSIAGRQIWPFLELFTLAGLVVARPLLDVIGRSPNFLLLRQADARDIILLAVTITLLPPLALWAVEVLAGLIGPRVQRVVHLTFVTGLLGLLGLEVAKALPPRGPALVVTGVVLGLAGGLLYAKAYAFKLWLRHLSPAPIVFLLVFLLVSPVTDLLRPTGATAAPAATVANARKGSIVILLLDELPLRSLLDQEGHIDRRLYPNFAKLADESTWYRNASTVAGMTRLAVPAILTGRYPVKDLAPIASRYPDNLFTLLGGSYGYDMKVFEGVTRLCSPPTCAAARPSSGRGGGFRRVLRDSAQLWTQIASPRDSVTDPAATLEEATVDPNKQAGTSAPLAKADPTWTPRSASFDGFLKSLRPSAKPTVHFVHVLLPHQPWKYLPSGLKYPERTLGESPARGGGWTSEPWPVQSRHQRHLMQTAYTDRLLGTVLQRLRDTGVYDDSLLMVTADHGMAFTPGQPGRANVTNTTAPDVLWVPMFIKRPGQASPSVNDVNMEHVDLLPTIADIMGFRAPWSVDGVSWADPSAAKRKRTEKWFHPLRGVRKAFEGPRNHSIALQGVTDRLLRPRDGDLAWFKFGPHADLVGQRARALPIAGNGGTARVIGLDEYRGVDPSTGSVPAQVGGQLTRTAPGTPSRPTIAVAINGVIGGVSGTFAGTFDPANSPPTWFSAMIPDSLMRQGENHLELFLVETTGGQRRLRRLTLDG